MQNVHSCGPAVGPELEKRTQLCSGAKDAKDMTNVSRLVPQEPANYEFAYEVNDPPTGQSFGHSEKRQGDDTRGSYFVELPDGRMQRVTYTAGPDGYRAQVIKRLEARPPVGHI